MARPEGAQPPLAPLARVHRASRRCSRTRPRRCLLTFALNVTLDGCDDHREMIADDELHDYFTELMDAAGAMLFGRTTYGRPAQMALRLDHRPDVEVVDDVQPIVSIP